MNTIPASGSYNHQASLKFFGLSYNPFPVAPDNTDFYISQHNDRIISKLTQAILSRKGFLILTGDIGLGKTTLSRRIIQIVEAHQVETSLILQSFYQEHTLLREIIKDFGIPLEETQNDLPMLMKKLNDFLLEKNNQGINCAIFIDDAQNLSTKSLELVRMISNFEADREKLVQILLIGQSELMEKLNCQELRQLKSRVSVIQSPQPLEKTEIGTYLQFKLNKAGDSGKIQVTPQAIKKLYHLTSGNLRHINILMDRALQYAFAENTWAVKPGFIVKAARDLAFDPPARKLSFPAMAMGLFLLVLILAGLGGGATVFYLATQKKELAPVENIRIDHPANAASPGTPLPADTAAEVDPGEMAVSETAVPEAVSSFLAAYHLNSYAHNFQAALLRKDFTDIAHRIFTQTGYQLIVLKTLPARVKSSFHILSPRDPDTPAQAYYLFWKPGFQIIRFHEKYRGKEIRELQKLLSAARLYNYHIDGIVGQIMLESVKVFQRQNQLPVTGFPDPETLFLLVNQTSAP